MNIKRLGKQNIYKGFWKDFKESASDTYVVFGTWGQTAVAHAYFIENIIMFIPFGLLAPIVFKRMRNAGFCVLIGFLCSCGIEISQLITQRGYCQLDDVVTNTMGVLVGWGIWKILNKLEKKIKLLVRKE